MIGICALSNIPLRKEASSRSEIVSMILFGETFTILTQDSEWTQVTTLSDNYTGWISSKQYAALETAIQNNEVVTNYPFAILSSDTGVIMAPFGSVLPNSSQTECSFNNTNYTILSKQNPVSFDSISVLAKQFLNTPYLWGGRTAFGIDCSGLTQAIFKSIGIQLPRDAYQQAEIGTTISFLEEVKTGDLAFFDNAEGHITHVGIMLDSYNIIHASGKVRIDPMDSHGIMNTDDHQYSHKLRIIKRVGRLVK